MKMPPGWSTLTSSSHGVEKSRIGLRLICFGTYPPFWEIGVKPAGVGTVVIDVEIVVVAMKVVSVMIEMRLFVLVTVSNISQKKSLKHFCVDRHTGPRDCHNFWRSRDDNRGGCYFSYGDMKCFWQWSDGFHRGQTNFFNSCQRDIDGASR